MDSFKLPKFASFHNMNGQKSHEPTKSHIHTTFTNYLGSAIVSGGFGIGVHGSTSNVPAAYRTNRMPYSAVAYPDNTKSACAAEGPVYQETGAIDGTGNAAPSQDKHNRISATDAARSLMKATKLLATAIPPALTPQPKQAPTGFRANFLLDFPDYAFQIPDGPHLHFTLVDVTAIMLNWFKNQFFMTRFLNNGLNSTVHTTILQEHRELNFSEVEVNRAKDNLSDSYRKKMRQNNKDWKKASHKAPDNWDSGNIVVNYFLPDSTREPGFKEPPSIPFKKLWNGMKKLPQGPDAGDLTRALEFAMRNQKTGSNGESQEFMFPDDIHMILRCIGYTNITPDHHDSAVITRYKQAAKAANPATRKRRRELEEAGIPAPRPKRRHTKAKTPEAKIPKEKPTTLANVLSPGEEVAKTPAPKTPEQHQAAGTSNVLVFGTNQLMMPVSNHSHQNSAQTGDGYSTARLMGAHSSPVLNQQACSHTARFTKGTGSMFEPSDEESNAASSKDLEIAAAPLVGTPSTKVAFSSTENFQDGPGASFGPFDEEVDVTPAYDPNSGMLTPQQVKTYVASDSAQSDPAAFDVFFSAPHATTLSQDNQAPYEHTLGPSPREDAVEANFSGSVAEMDALVTYHQDTNYVSLFFPEPALDFSLMNQAIPMSDMEQINAWPQYPDTQLLRDCVEADDPDDHSDLARAARWCRDPANKAEEYVIGHAWLALGLEEVLQDAERYEQGLLG